MEFPSFSNPSSCNSTSVAASSEKMKMKKTKKGVAAVKLSTDPQSVAARQRRHRISDRFKILQTMVPGGTKMDTVSMLEQAIQYVKFLKNQIWLHQSIITLVDHNASAAADHPIPIPIPTTISNLHPNKCALPPFHDQDSDSCDDCYALERFLAQSSAQLQLPESSFSGEGNWGLI